VGFTYRSVSQCCLLTVSCGPYTVVPQAVFVLNTCWSHVLVCFATIPATSILIERDPILMSRADVTRLLRGVYHDGRTCCTVANIGLPCVTAGQWIHLIAGMHIFISIVRTGICVVMAVSSSVQDRTEMIWKSLDYCPCSVLTV
jgi:hypothetical protein